LTLTNCVLNSLSQKLDVSALGQTVISSPCHDILEPIGRQLSLIVYST